MRKDIIIQRNGVLLNRRTSEHCLFREDTPVESLHLHTLVSSVVQLRFAVGQQIIITGVLLTEHEQFVEP